MTEEGDGGACHIYSRTRTNNQVPVDVLRDTGKMVIRKRAGHQARTDITKELVLSAAEAVFLREGFERAQIETIAEAAGRTKGSIYAHFKNKDDLFLALYALRTREHVDRVLERISQAEDQAGARREFKAFLLEVLRDRSWPLLTLEFKLYSIRHPETRERWIPINATVRLAEGDLLRRKMFGNLSAQQVEEVNANLALIGPLLSCLILETHFEPELLTEKRLSKVYDRVLEALVLDPRA